MPGANSGTPASLRATLGPNYIFVLPRTYITVRIQSHRSYLPWLRFPKELFQHQSVVRLSDHPITHLNRCASATYGIVRTCQPFPSSLLSLPSLQHPYPNFCFPYSSSRRSEEWGGYVYRAYRPQRVH